MPRNTLLIVLIFISFFSFNANLFASNEVKQLGTIDGQNVKVTDLKIKEYMRWYHKAKDIRDLEMKYFNYYSYKNILKKEADKEGLSVNEYLRTKIYSSIPVITEKEVDQYIQDHESKYEKFFSDMDALKDRIRTGLLEERKDQKEEDIQQKLFAEYHVKFNFNPIEMPKFDIPVEKEDILVGLEISPVSIVSFMDLECPYCSNFFQKLIDLQNKYPQYIHIVIKHFPLSFHRNSKQLALEAECAKKSGFLYEYIRKIFSDNEFSECSNCRDDTLKEFGTTLEERDDCINNESIRKKIQLDIQKGKDFGITGTPTTFINGFPLIGNASMEELEDLFNKQLEYARGKK